MSSTVYLAVGGDYSDYRVYAVFSNKDTAEAFVMHRDSYADRVEERELYDSMPSRSKWYWIERMKLGTGEVVHRSNVFWDFDGPPFVGHKRDTASYSKWQYGERAFGKDKAAVKAAWDEAQAAKEAASVAR